MYKLIFTIMMLTCAIGKAQMTTTYELDTNKSVINWTGSYSFSFNDRTGTVHFTSGKLYTVSDQITGGDFTIDMTSIDNEDHRQGRGPVNHLKDSDFFDVSIHPKATLKMTSIKYHKDENIHKIEADITIKGITKSQKFYAVADGSAKTLTAKFKIDRTRWGITYNNNVKDKAISDAIAFDVYLVFK